MTKLDKLKTLIPLEDLEHSAQQQIYDALSLPFLKTLAIMPDCHTGYTLPIGGVALLDSIISPEYVGFDIGCGMCCVVTDRDVSEFSSKYFDDIFDKLYKIPVGLGSSHDDYDNDKIKFSSASGDKDLVDKVNSKLNSQLGTLGSGNHFIEIGNNEEGKLVVTIHSGSRNPGHTIASYYMNLAKEVDKHLPAGFLEFKGIYGQQYKKDMDFAIEYAFENRFIMMLDVLTILGFSRKEIRKYEEFLINESHNHAVERGDGILHRKGATPAKEGMLGVIPGTMKSGVYITRGLGNEEYLSSASHGAGRVMSRSKAKKSISIEQHKDWMKGILAKVVESTIDEAHGAYKNVHDVVKAQAGIVVDVIDYVRPIINIKG